MTDSRMRASFACTQVLTRGANFLRACDTGLQRQISRCDARLDLDAVGKTLGPEGRATGELAWAALQQIPRRARDDIAEKEPL